MGLFGPTTYKKTVSYGDEQAASLQPQAFSTWGMIGNMGNPYGTQIDKAINDAYARAAADMRASGRQSSGDISRYWRLPGESVGAQVGLQGQNNMLNAALQAAGYMSRLTGQRPQYSFDSSTPWDNFFGGLATLYKPVEPLMRAAGAWPESWTQGTPTQQMMGNTVAQNQALYGGNPMMQQYGNAQNMAMQGYLTPYYQMGF